jgi:hypothetical protein
MAIAERRLAAVADVQRPGRVRGHHLDLHPLGWGWTAILPDLGLLSDDFPDPYLKTFDLTAGDVTLLRDDIAIPIAPFLGTMGVCPAGASQQAVMPPGRFGGNMDTRQLVSGTTLYLPVQVGGALFSCGDAHAVRVSLVVIRAELGVEGRELTGLTAGLDSGGVVLVQLGQQPGRHRGQVPAGQVAVFSSLTASVELK